MQNTLDKIIDDSPGGQFLSSNPSTLKNQYKGYNLEQKPQNGKSTATITFVTPTNR